MADEIIHIVNSKLLVTHEMQQFIKAKGYELHIFGEFSDFIEALNHERKPDLVLYEIISLTADIVEYIQEIKKLPEVHDIPNIAVLNRATKNLVLFLAQMGIKDIVVKPFDKDALLETIDKAIAPVEGNCFRIREQKNRDKFTVIEFLKALDAKNSNKVDKFLSRLLKKGIKKIAFDFRRVSHIDSSGIGILVVCKKRVDIAGGELKIGNLEQHIVEIMKTLNLDQILDIVDDVHSLDTGMEDDAAESELALEANESESVVDNADGTDSGQDPPVSESEESHAETEPETVKVDESQ